MHLFAKCFDKGLQFDNGMGDERIAGLGADGIRLAVHFLAKEIEFAATRFGRVEEIDCVFEVRLQARQFFGDIASIGIKGDFPADRRIVGREFYLEFSDSFEEIFPVERRKERCARGDLEAQGFHSVESLFQIGPKRFSFVAPHFGMGFEGLMESRLDGRAHAFHRNGFRFCEATRSLSEFG